MKKPGMLGLMAVVLVPIVCLCVSSTVLAHVAQRDGEITGTLHIDPADSPIAGEESLLIFLFDDETNRFRATICDCTVTIVNSAERETKLLSVQLPRIGTLPFTFPKKAVYTVTINGFPKQGSTFQSFTLSYDVRVERDSGTDSKQSIFTQIQSITQYVFGEEVAHFILHHLFHIIIFGGGILMAAVLVIRDKN